jgi:hypothetical protein
MNLDRGPLVARETLAIHFEGTICKTACKVYPSLMLNCLRGLLGGLVSGFRIAVQFLHHRYQSAQPQKLTTSNTCTEISEEEAMGLHQ